MRVAVTILVFCVAALLALGLVMLYSASMTQVGARYLLMQLIWCGLGLAVCVAAALSDYRQLKKIWWLIFAAAALMLVLVLIPHIGVVRGHARRWFAYGRFSFQPSEFGKLALLVALAWYGERYQRKMASWKVGIAIPGLMIGLIVGLIFKEPDVGNAMLLAVVSGIILLTAGIRLLYFLPPVLVCAVAVSAFIYHNPMRSERIYSWLHLEETKKDKGLQAYQAMVALGSGGVAGKGLGDGRQKHGFLPEHDTDFIFSMIGEELGLIATLSVVVAFAAILLCGLCIAVNASDTFGLLLGVGISFLIGMQAMINIGVVTGALPNKGLPLPFISRGGSNLMILLGSIGVLLSIARHAKVREDLSTPATKESRRGSNPFAPPERERPAANARQRQSWGWRAWFLPNSRNPESSGLSRA